MIPTPTLPYLAILPVVDNLAESHREFFRNSIAHYFPQFSKRECHFLSGSLFPPILSHAEHIWVMASIWINLLSWLTILQNCILQKLPFSDISAKFDLSPPGWTLSTAVCLTAIEDDLAVHENSRHSRGSSYSAFSSCFSSSFLVSFVPTPF